MLLASSASAQRLSELTLPQRVRLNAPAMALRDVRGTLSRLTGDTLVVDELKVPLRQVTTLDVSTHSSSQWRWGAVVGAAAGAVWGIVQCRRSECQEADLPFHYSVITAGAGALAGLVIGANVRTDRWRAVSFGVRSGN